MVAPTETGDFRNCCAKSHVRAANTSRREAAHHLGVAQTSLFAQAKNIIATNGRPAAHLVRSNP